MINDRNITTDALKIVDDSSWERGGEKEIQSRGKFFFEKGQTRLAILAIESI